MKSTPQLLFIIISAVIAVCIGSAVLADTSDASDDILCGDNLRWEYSSGTLAIRGFGDMYDYADQSKTPWYRFAGEIEEIDFVTAPGMEISSIGNYAFCGIKGLEKVELPSSVVSIGSYSFACCTGLKSLVIPDNVKQIGSYAFSGCIGMASVTISDSVNTIGAHAFSGCTCLNFVEIPAGVGSLEMPVFDNCTSLRGIIVNQNNTVYSSANGIVFSKDGTTLVLYPCGMRGTEYAVPDRVTAIGDSAFETCRYLGSLALSGPVRTIGDAAFSGCTGLSHVYLSASVGPIGLRAFADCPSLCEIAVDGNNAYYCSENGIVFNKNRTVLVLCPEGFSCEEYEVPSTVNKIGESAFRDVKGLKKVTFVTDQANAEIGAFSFYRSGLTSIVVPSGLMKMGEGAFKECADLKTVDFGYVSKLIKIENGTFEGCSSLEEVKIPAGVLEIGHRAFFGCYRLASVEIPYTVETIDGESFGLCPMGIAVDDWTDLDIGPGDYGLPEIATVNHRALCTVTFSTGEAGNEGTIIPSATAIAYYGHSFEFPQTARWTGHIFNGWCTPDGTLLDTDGLWPYAEDTVLTACWTAETYTVVFDANLGSFSGGEAAVFGHPVYGEAFSLGSEPSNGSIGFLGWNTEKDGSGTSFRDGERWLFADTGVMYALWENKPFQVIFDANLGNFDNGSTSVRGSPYYGTVFELGTIPGNSSLKFLGWNTERDGTGTSFRDGERWLITDPVTVYAVWENRCYANVVFDANLGHFPDGAYDTAGSPEYGKTFVLGSKPANGSLKFLGWNTKDDGTGISFRDGERWLITDPVRMYAVWENKFYENVVFDANLGNFDDGSITVCGSPTYGTVFELGAIPENGSLKFLGWNTEKDGTGIFFRDGERWLITDPVTVYAAWENRLYINVAFDANLGHFPDGAAAVIGSPTYGETFALGPEPANGSLKFLGWNTEKDGTGIFFRNGERWLITDPVTVYAVWENKCYENVVFDANGGLFGDGSAAVCGSPVYGWPFDLGTIPENGKLKFLGWNTEADGTGAFVEDGARWLITDPVTVYAVWTQVFDVVFDANGGLFGDGSAAVCRSLYCGMIFSLGETPENGTLGFLGWNTERDGTGVSFEDGARWTIADPVTVYAVWEARIYRVVFDANGGLFDGSDVSVYGFPHYGKTFELSKVPVNSSLGFLGWNTKKDGTGLSFRDGERWTIAEPETVYAVWENRCYGDVVFDANLGCFGSGSATVFGSPCYGTFFDLGAIPENGSLKFLGWNTEADGTGLSFRDGERWLITDPVTVYAVWEARTYEVVFDANLGHFPDGASALAGSPMYGKAFFLSPKPANGSLRFLGWNTEADGTGLSFKDGERWLITDPVTVYAVWEARTYEVVFDANLGHFDDGSASVCGSPMYGKTFVLGMGPANGSLRFLGWNTEKDGTGTLFRDRERWLITDPVTVYAVWEARTYEVVFDANGGHFPDGASAAAGSPMYGKTFALVPEPANGSLEFLGWNTEADGTGTSFKDRERWLITDPVTVYAVWEARMYRVVFDANGGLFDGTGDAVCGFPCYGKTFALGSEPANGSLRFLGWNTEADGTGTSFKDRERWLITDPVTVYAVWENKRYENVVFDANLGYFSSGSAAVCGSPTYGTVFELGAIPENGGLGFLGWNTEKDGTGASFRDGERWLITDPVTVYAVWENKLLEVTFDANLGHFPDGASAAAGSPTYGKVFFLSPKPVNGSLRFLGWNTEKDGTGTSFRDGERWLIAGPVTVYAVWDNKCYGNVVFDANLGSFDDGSASVCGSPTYGEVFELGAMPGNSDLGFLGWNTEKDGTGVSFRDGERWLITDPVTVYAVWEARMYRVVFDANGGNFDNGSVSVCGVPVYGQTFALGAIPANGSLSFMWWNTEADGTGVSFRDGERWLITDPVTVYAVWEVRMFRVVFDANGGIFDGTGDVICGFPYYGKTFEPPKVPVNGSLGFIGWNTEADGTGTSFKDGERWLIADPVTVYAVWENKCYGNVVFDANLGYFDDGSAAVHGSPHYGTVFKLGATPGNGGLRFLGWNTEKDGTGASFRDGERWLITDPVTVYAVWENKWYGNVVFDANLGHFPDGASVIAGSPTYGKVFFLGPKPANGSLGFLGWNTEKDGSGTSFRDGERWLITDPVRVYAVWENKCCGNVVFDANLGNFDDGSSAVRGSPTYGTVFELGAMPKNSGLGFLGWNTEKDGTGISFRDGERWLIADPVTVYAMWEDRMYEVVFDANGGLFDGFRDAARGYPHYGWTFELLKTPVNSSLDFLGWNTKDDGTGVSFRDGGRWLFTDCGVLYAVWENRCYGNVIFDANLGRFSDGTSAAAGSPHYGTVFSLGETPGNGSLGFLGWNTEADGTGISFRDGERWLITDPVTVYAVWEDRMYEVVFDANGGLFDGSDGSICGYPHYGRTFELPKKPANGSLGFLGWNTEKDGSGLSFEDGGRWLITDPVRVYAVWENKCCGNVVFDANLGNFDDGSASVRGSPTYGQTFVLGARPANGSLKFLGWNTEADGTGISFRDGERWLITDPDTVYAMWEDRMYEVVFDANGGLFDGFRDTARGYPHYGRTFEPSKAPVNGSLDLIGWNTEKDGSGTFFRNGERWLITDPVTVYAVWEERMFKVVFDANGGLFNGSSDSICGYPHYGKTFELLKDPVNGSLGFLGWNTERDGTGVPFEDGGQWLITDPGTVYAVWEARTYEVVFDANLGHFEDGSASVRGSPVYGWLFDLGAAPRNSDLGLMGWSTRDDGSGAFFRDGERWLITDPVTVYAVWEARTYEVVFDANGGSFDDGSASVRGSPTYGQTFVLGARPANGSLKFLGWNTEKDGTGTFFAERERWLIAGPDTVYAVWENKCYRNVVFDANGGSFDDGSASVYGSPTYGTVFELGAAPGNSDLRFLGWNTEKSGGGTSFRDGERWLIADSDTVYAVWEARMYRVVFDANRGNFDNGSMAAYGYPCYGEVFEFGETPGNSDLGFLGWNTKDDGSGAFFRDGERWLFTDCDVLYAVWENRRYENVVFDANGGLSGDGGTFVCGSPCYGTVFRLRDTPGNGSLEFLGWNTKDDGTGTSFADGERWLFTDCRALYAVWENRCYENVVFSANGGLFYRGTDEVTGSPTYGKEFCLGKVLFNGSLMFDGWNSAPDGTGTSFADGERWLITDPVTVYAVWENRCYENVTFDANGGLFCDGREKVSGSPTYGAEFSLRQTLANGGLVLLGWNTEKDGSGLSFRDGERWLITDPVTVYAQWGDAERSDVVFDANLGSFGGGSAAVHGSPEYGKTFVLGSEPANGSLGFLGWNTERDGTGASFRDGERWLIAGSGTVYAVWEARTYEVVFDANGGRFPDGTDDVPGSPEYGKAFDLNNMPANSDLMFRGWNTERDGSGASFENGKRWLITDPVRVYAVWENRCYGNVVFDANLGHFPDGAETVRGSPTYGIVFSLGTVPVNGSLGFLGWNTEADGNGTFAGDGEMWTIADPVTVYAVWEARMYEVVFDANGGIFDSNKNEMAGSPAYGKTFDLQSMPLNGSLKFMGWNTEADGSGTLYRNGERWLITDPVRVYAVWENRLYANVIFDANGGIFDDDSEAVYGSPTYGKTFVLGSEPANGSLGFLGWNTERDGTGASFRDGERWLITDPFIVYAVWDYGPCESAVSDAGGGDPDDGPVPSADLRAA